MYKLILIALAIFSIVIACSSNKPTESNEVSVIGTWKLSSLYVNGVQKNPDNYNDVPVKLKFNSGGTGYAWLEDYGAADTTESGTIVWSISGSQMTVQIASDDAVTVTYSVTAANLSLVFTTGSKLVFSR